MTQRKAKTVAGRSRFPKWPGRRGAGAIPPFTDVSEAVVKLPERRRIRVRKCVPWNALPSCRPGARKKLRGLFMTAGGIRPNAAIRAEAFMYSKGTYAYGGYPDIDELFHARERRRTSARALLHQIQRLTIMSGRCLPRSWTCAGSRAWGHDR